MTWNSEIEIAGVAVPIIYVEREGLPEDCKGEYRVVDQPQIRVLEGMEEGYRNLVVAHEIMHAWLDLTGMRERFDDETNEALANNLAPLLVKLKGME